MKIKYNKVIKVKNHVKPIHSDLRKEPELILGNDYFISFGSNKVIPGILLGIIDEGKNSLKQVQIGKKDNSPLGHGDIYKVYSDEIGITPEEAVINTVTF